MKILFISLGCDKNLVDSEEMLGLLNSRGYTFTDDETVYNKKGSNTLLARILPPFHTSNTAYSLIEALLHSPQSIFILYS